MASARINFVTDQTVKKRAEQVFRRLGLDLSSGLNVYLHQVAMTGGLPFPVELPNTGRSSKKKLK
jgi:DNA-damage-inducible protein J